MRGGGGDFGDCTRPSLIHCCMMCVMEVSRISCYIEDVIFVTFSVNFFFLFFCTTESPFNAPGFILFTSRLRLFGQYLRRLELVVKYFPWTFGACFQDGG